MHYNLTIQFKDERIRIDRPTFECQNPIHGALITLTQKQNLYAPGIYRIFNPKNGKVEMENVKSQLESFFNNLCNRIVSSIEEEAVDDW